MVLMNSMTLYDVTFMPLYDVIFTSDMGILVMLDFCGIVFQDKGMGSEINAFLACYLIHVALREQ